MNRRRIWVAATLLAGCLTVSADAEWTDVVNPNSGALLSPRLYYNPASGLLSVGNVGPNGMVDSFDNSTLRGDDVGMISLLVTYNGDTSDLSAVLPVFGNGIAWAAPTVFDGKIRLNGVPIAASFLPIETDLVPVVQLPTGLWVSDFLDPSTGRIGCEMGVNFNFGAPGATLFDTDCRDQFLIPEPSAVGLAWPILLLALRRRRI